MTSVRILLVHAEPSEKLLAKYRAALAAVCDSEVTAFVEPGPGNSSRYERLATKLRRDGRILPALRERYPAKGSHELFVLVTFSAGYKLAERLLEVPADRDAIDGWVALDSLHTRFDPDGTASDAQLEPFADFARLAADGRKLCWIGHTDVETPRPACRVAFASTTETANEILRLAGVPELGKRLDNGSVIRAELGAFRVQAFDLRDAKHQEQEHGLALWDWGPTFTASAVQTLLAMREPTIPPPAPAEVVMPWQDPSLSLGQRAVLYSQAEARTVCEEPPGSNNGKRIREYFEPAYRLRDGKLLRELGIRSGNWCAVAACFAARAVALPGETIPHPYCASGIELEQASQVGPRASFRPTSAVLGGLWTPRCGDLVILDRDDPKVRGDEWQRHVARVVAWRDDGSYVTIDGNAGQAWQPAVERHIRDANPSGHRRAPRGFIEYPR